jgi:hypothetical protein
MLMGLQIKLMQLQPRTLLMLKQFGKKEICDNEELGMSEDGDFVYN